MTATSASIPWPSETSHDALGARIRTAGLIAIDGLPCSGYRPYDWCSGQISSIARELYRRGPLIVEGCSVLDPQLEPHYGLRLFVASDRETVLAARRARDGDHDAENWQRLFLPSVDLYMATLPERRADFVISGRG